jgi:hypothetical protein
MAEQFNRTPEWVEANMGDSNSLAVIHKNLSGEESTPRSPETATDAVPRAPAVQSVPPDVDNLEGVAFYDPRRAEKYWVSDTSRHTTFSAAVAVMAAMYGRSPEWIRANIGDSNDLATIHRNLAGQGNR